MAEIDPITLAVIQGVLESTQREMTLTIEKTSRSSVFNIARDYSNALFSGDGEMVLQGQDIPIHLGSLMPALRSVADYFADDIHPGDVFYHNDPAWSGSHIVDCCMYKPVFYRDELVFWTVSKGHVTDIGGPVPAGYNPDAKEIYAEGLRIPPLKIWDRGTERRDVVNFILTNVRSRRLQAGDMRAQLAAVTIGERNLIGLLDKYGRDTVMAGMAQLLDLAEAQMRAFIADIPDGRYRGSSVLEEPAADSVFHQLVRGQLAVRGISRADDVRPASAAVQRGPVPAAVGRRRSARHADQCQRAGPPLQLHDHPVGIDHRCGAHGPGTGVARTRGRLVGPLQRAEHRRERSSVGRRLRVHDSGDDHQRRRGVPQNGWLARGRPAVLLRRAHQR